MGSELAPSRREVRPFGEIFLPNNAGSSIAKDFTRDDGYFFTWAFGKSCGRIANGSAPSVSLRSFMCTAAQRADSVIAVCVARSPERTTAGGYGETVHLGQ
jgi:hypothetical protein